MDDETFLRIIFVSFITALLLMLVFLPLRAAISSNSYNYTDYCVDRFGEGFLPKNTEGYDLMKCYSIENGDMVEKVFRISKARKLAKCNYNVGFWELNKWKLNNCNWNKDALVALGEGEKNG